MDLNNLWSEYDLNSKKQNSRCLAVNTILEGKYLVGPVLGQGGFGITYAGYDLNMETKIAIKEYFPVELVSRDTTTIHGDRVLSLGGEKSVTYQAGLKKYVAEAQNVSQFSEVPGVVSVKDFFYANETAYIVMEFIDGISLKDYLKEQGGRLNEEETLKIMKPVLEAMVQVHKSGMIHRDISPDNIMLTFCGASENGKSGDKGNVSYKSPAGVGAAISGTGNRNIQSVKLIDFGAARMTEKNDQKSLTIILKHGYAPEEQYRTRGEQGSWTDVYALCAVLYRMLTGETPVPAMDRMFQDELKTFEQQGIKVSANTKAAILKGLAVKKENRIQSVQELIGALYEGKKPAAVKTGKDKRKTSLFVGIGAMAVMAAVAGVLFLSGGKADLRQTADGAGTTAEVESNGNGAEDVLGVAEGAENKAAEADEDGAETKTEAMIFAEDGALDELGEPIVAYHPQDAFAEFNQYLVMCKPDGTVDVKGSDEMGYYAAKEWTGVVSVKMGYYHVLGLRSDGRVLVTEQNRHDYGQYDIECWTDIVDIDAGPLMSLGVTADGTVLASGDGNNTDIDLYHLAEWTDIKQIACSNLGCIAGLKYDGTVLFEGSYDADISGWEKVENIFFRSGSILVGVEADGTVHAVALGEEASRAEEAEAYQTMPKMKQIVHSHEGITMEGTVLSTDVSETVAGWEDMAAMISWNGTWGIKEDGTVIKEQLPNRGNAEFDDFKNLAWVRLVRSGADTGLVGKTGAGQVLTYGNNGLWIDLIDGAENNADIADAEEDLVVLEDGTLYGPDGYKDLLPASGIKEAVRDSGGCILLKKDGTVEAYGTHVYKHQCADAVKAWNQIVQICGYCEWAVGLRNDGSVVGTWDFGFEVGTVKGIYGSKSACFGVRKDGTVVMLSSFRKKEYYDLAQAEQWSGIKELAVSESHIVGLKEDGTVVAVGNNSNGECDVEAWAHVVSVDAAEGCTIGLTEDGELLMAGSLYY